MAKTKRSALTALGRKFDEVGKVLNDLDMRSVPQADRLSDEELEAVRCGALAVTSAIGGETGILGGRMAKVSAEASAMGVACAIAASAIEAHIHFTVDAEPAPTTSVRITIEHEG